MENQNVNSFNSPVYGSELLGAMRVQMPNGNMVLFTPDLVMDFLRDAIDIVLQPEINKSLIVEQVERNVFDGITYRVLEENVILVVAQLIERDLAYSYLGARLMNNKIFAEVLGYSPTIENRIESYKRAFVDGIHEGVEAAIFDKRLLTFDLHELASHLVVSRDNLMRYLGVKTLHNRYLKKANNHKFELVQTFWMRVAMGLAIESPNKNQDAIDFYNVMSQLHYVPSTPTLLHAGLIHSQLSSCYLTYVSDDLHHIFKCFGDNAQLSKWSGGVANAWSALRGTGALIKTIGIGSQGTMPFLKIANDTTAAINRSGSRRGAVCAYMENWHIDYEDFLDLRRNTGDERRRTHDMNTASWIPDLFMKRVLEDKNWTMFSPEEVPLLNETFGKKFEELYVGYEQKVVLGEIRLHKTMPARELWKKMLTRLFETGHPWNTFKDASNVRSPQDHAGMIHSSNLCTEITLNTSVEETAVCNLGSINLTHMLAEDGSINEPLIAKTIESAMKMLDNVVDINFYPTKEAQTSNMRHRPVGLGIMGFQDVVAMKGFVFDSQQALEFVDEITEMISYYAILGSSKLAKERGAYESFKGSKWDRNIFPIDTLALLAQERGMEIPMIGKARKDWAPVRQHVAQYGMRNSNTMAIAPTATISNIAGCYPCIEPVFKNLYAKSNTSGEFAITNPYLEKDLKKIGLWTEDIRDKVKYYDGSVQAIEEIPLRIREKYKTAFELDPIKLIDITAARGKWIDQSQSHNVFLQGVSGKKLYDLYMHSWRVGLKSMYYLRTLGASQIEKSTLDASKFGYTQMREYKAETTTVTHEEITQTIIVETVIETKIDTSSETDISGKACILTDPECESCQ